MLVLPDTRLCYTLYMYIHIHTTYMHTHTPHTPHTLSPSPSLLLPPLSFLQAAAKTGFSLRPRRTDLVVDDDQDPEHTYHSDHTAAAGSNVPLEAIRLATGELALRIAEERRRRAVGLATCTCGMCGVGGVGVGMACCVGE